MLTTHTITLPTPEQRAVYAACEERYSEIIKFEWPELGTVLELWVRDIDGRPSQLFVTPEGETRVHYFGGVPARLYGALPKREDARREWGKGLPKHALKHMPTTPQADPQASSSYEEHENELDRQAGITPQDRAEALRDLPMEG